MMVGNFVFAVVVGLVVVLSSLVLILGHFVPLLLHNRVVPKGSFGWPLLGETLRFFSPHASTTIGSFLEEHCYRYGKVFKSHLFFTPAIVSCDQELNQFILQNEEKLFQCSYPKPIHGILGKSSMIVVVGDNHKRLRNLALTLVSSTKSRAGYLNDVERIALDIQNSWNRSKVLFCDEARKYTFSVIVKQVLGLEPHELKTRRILEDFLTFMKGLISFPLYVPGTSYTKAVKARSRISLTVKGIIEERRKSGADSKNKGDFLDVLLSMNNLTEEERISFVLDSLLGGYETTSLLLSMVVYFLGQSPMALSQLKSEHQTIRDSKKYCGYLTSEDYKKMEFTQCVINEALRCGNIVKFVHRKALKDVTYKEYLIPCGWKVLPVLSAVHLDSTLHENAQEFNPWRWEGQNQTSCRSFTPFGGGPRLCPGSELAKIEVAFFIHHLLLKFRWRSEGEDIPMAYPYVEFPKGLPIEIEPISTSHD